MTSPRSTPSVSRRTTLAALAAAGLGASVATRAQATSIRQDTKDYSDHPFCGSWMAMALPSYEGGPPVPAVSINFADGSTYYEFPLSQRGNDGVQFVSGHAGTWEPYDERTGHFSNIQFVSNLDGDVVSIILIDGYPQVSEDGQTFIDDFHLSTVTILDASGNVVAEILPGSPAPPITAKRMSPGVFGFPNDGTPEASPES